MRTLRISASSFTLFNLIWQSRQFIPQIKLWSTTPVRTIDHLYKTGRPRRDPDMLIHNCVWFTTLFAFLIVCCCISTSPCLFKLTVHIQQSSLLFLLVTLSPFCLNYLIQASTLPLRSACLTLKHASPQGALREPCHKAVRCYYLSFTFATFVIPNSFQEDWVTFLDSLIPFPESFGTFL